MKEDRNSNYGYKSYDNLKTAVKMDQQERQDFKTTITGMLKNNGYTEETDYSIRMDTKGNAHVEFKPGVPVNLEIRGTNGQVSKGIDKSNGRE